MKKQSLWLRGLLLLCLLIAGWLIWWPGQNINRKENENQQMQQEASTHQADGKTDSRAEPSTLSTTKPQQPQITTTENTPTSDDRMAKGGQYMLQQNVPIMFWGKVVDQNAQSLADVHIIMSARQWRPSTPTNVDAAFQKHEIKTDVEGRFEWTGIEGDALELELIEKQGYRPSPKTPHNLELSSSSSENPAIFKMWKEGAKEHLVEGSKLFGIDSDGRVYTLNLLDGKKVEGAAEGDLRVSIVRPSGVKARDKYQWSFVIEGVDGGLLETDDEFMYLAPESGYKQRFAMQLDSADPEWTPLVKKQLFMRSRDGQVYGRISIEVHAIYNVHSAVEINYAVNPAGSRDLQP